jgi:YcxB-like protein
MNANYHIEVTFRLSVRDVYRANVAIMLGKMKWVSWLLFGVAMVILSGAMFGLVFNGPTFAARVTAGSFFGILFVPLFASYMLFGAPYFAARNLLRNNPNAGGPLHYVFTTNGVVVESPTGHSEIKWTAYLIVRETEDLILLFPQKNLAYPIPKRFFASENELKDFRELVRANCRGTAKLRGQ